MKTPATRDPLISVIMPVFNLAHVVHEAIESVLTQTTTDLELIVVDDASTDTTADIVERYQKLDPRVQVVQNTTNSRRSNIQWEPRNNGLQIARGTLIAYLDGDNTWQPQALEALTGPLLGDPEIQLSYCRSRNFHDPAELDAVIAADARQAVDRGTDWVVFAQQELDVTELGRSQYVDTNEMMHRASVFHGLGSLSRPRRCWEVSGLIMVC